MKRRILSIITALALCLSLCPTWALAAEADPSLCKHHRSHTEDCGYTAPTEGHDCGHRHTAECYTKGVLPDADGGDYYEIGADTENLLDCQHSHNSECGYVQADPGAPCGYACRICPIEALIAALPEQVTEDNADDVRAQLDHILDLYRELNEDEQEEINLSRIYALQGALDAANDPDTIEGEVSVDYQEASWNSGVTYTTQTAASCTPVADSTDAVTWDAGWYVVNSTVTISEPITVTGAVNLILADGCTLNAKKGIVVTTGNSLTIYAQSGGTGTLNATGTADSSNNASAGIGGSTSSFDSGAITIHGGVINATGGSAGSISYGGAGIGGGTPGYGNGGSSGAITIYGGTVTANSGAGDVTGAGIGGGGGLTGGGAGNNIQIYGGTINATGSNKGAGIGGGGSTSNPNSSYKSGDGAVTISGGTVTAVGGNYAAGIGGGGGYYYKNEYTSGGLTGGAGSVTISGGIVDASSPTDVYYADYKGAPIGNGGNTTAAATVSKTTGIVFENGAGTVCGDVTLDGSYTVPAGYTLNIPAGASLSGSGTLSGGGTFTTENLTADMISVPEDWHYTGEDLTEKIKDAVSLNGEITICGQTFTASTDGWELSVEKVSELEYTVKYTHTDKGTLSKTVTIARGQTALSDVVTYKGDGTTPANTFSVGETIIVKATATFPANNAIMAAAEFDTPTGEQMAVYYNDTQISAPSTVENGVHTMTVDTSNLPESALNKEIGLTVKYIESDNASGATAITNVTVTAVAKVEKGSTTTYVGALADAFTEGNSGATVTLLSEVDLGTDRIRISGSHTFTLNLNGQTVKASYYGAFQISGGSLTIQDSGTGGKIESSNITIEVTGGTLSVQSGTVLGLHGVKITSGTVNISGGTISGSDTGLWVSGGGNITLSGGTFSGVVAVQVDTNASVTLKDLLASECAYHQNDIPVANAAGPGGEVPLDAKPAWLPGTVTVKECNHTGGLVPSENGYQHGGPCKCCNTALTAENHTLGADNQCSGCGAALAAKVEKSGSDTIYVEASNLASAFAAENTGATVTLLKDVDLGKNDLTLLSGTFTLDCGAFTLSSSSEYFVIKLDNADLTFAGGTIQCNGTGNAVLCAIGTFTMTGGTLNAASDYALNCAYSGEANIQGGTVGTQGKGLYIGNPDGVKLSGGTYATICIGSNYGTQKVPLSTILADGRAAYGPDGPITRDTVDAELTGPIIVKECEHDGVTVQDQGNGKHGLDCPYCGYHSKHTTTLTATASGNTVTFRGGCASCDYQEEALAAAAFTFPKLTYGQTGQTVSCTWEHPNGYALMVQIDSGEELQIDVSDTQVSLPLEQLFGSQEINAGNYQLHVYCRSYADVTSNVCSLSFTVEKAPLTPSITGTATKTYDGTTAAPEGLEIALTGLVEGDSVTASASFAYNSENVNEANAITATNITLGGADAGNYRLTSDSASIEGTITKADQAAPAAPAATEENIKDTSITLTIIANAEYSKDGTNWQASPTFTGLDPNRAYTFYARLKEDGNHNASPSSTASITTRKMMLGNATVTVSGSYTYTGAAQTPAVAVVKNGKTLTAGTDYTVSYANNTNAGTATVTITGMGDYEGTNSTTFTIQRKTLTVAGAIAAGRPYNGTNTVTITGVTLDGVVNGDTVSVSTANLTGTLNGSNVGSYTAVTLPALTLTGGGAGNYTLTRPAGAVSTSVTISKADALTPKTGDLAVANNQAHTYTYGLGALRPDLPAGMSFGSSAVTYELGAVSLGSYYTGSGAKIEGQTLTLPIEAVNNDKAQGIGTITVTIHTGNFEDMTATINVRSVNKTIPTGAPTLSAATLTYGQPLSTITLRGDMAAGATPVPGKFEWSSPDNRPAVQEAYAAAWVFTPTDNNTYAIVNGTSTIKVVPASVAGAVVTLSPTSFRYDGQSHSPTVTSVKLGDTTLTADTDYTVEIPTETAAGTYTVTITGKGNYTGTAAATFTINPVETGDEFEDESGTTLRLEVETGLSTVPEALKNNAKYDTPAKIEAELRTQVEQVMSNVGENIAVFDVTLQYKDESGAWHTVDPNDFPTEGVTAILPYPDGTGATGYTFTVQHLISSGTQAGTMETLSYTLTADGLQCKFLTLSPVAIGYQAAAKPVDPVNPNPGGGSGGGGGGVSTYAVTVEKAEHGKVTANRTNAGSGSTVTLTVTPEDGYVLDTLTVTDSRGNAIKLTAQGNGKYTFTMPGRAVTVKAAFAPLPDGTACDGGEGCPSRGFTDLGSVGTWYHEAVDYVLRNNLMGGYGNGTFGPNDTLTRAQFAQILFNKEGRPVVNYLLQFTDVSGEAWYTEAVRWAASQGIVGGYADGRFGPNDNITREQLAVMLWRYAGSPAATDKELHFTDTDKASGFALEALRWAVENGVMGGYSDGRLDPKGLATRAQVAQMLKNYLEK